MATTTNYGWTTPDDTALVKDGAAAIRTLGSSVDTTTKALNPSTTLGDIEYRSSTANTNTRLGIGSSGQALTVVAGVPSWAASPTSVLTTTGDTLYASAANTLERLAIGSSGQVLTVSGGLPSWATPTGNSENWTLLNTGGTALTGSATITISGITGQNKLWVMINAASIVNSSGYLSLLINNDNTAKYATQGRNDVPQATYSATSFTASGSNLNVASNFELAGWANNADSTARVALMINGANSSGAKIVNSISGVLPGSGANPRHYAFQGVYTGSSTISSLVFKSDNGNFDAGTVYVYGSAN